VESPSRYKAIKPRTSTLLWRAYIGSAFGGARSGSGAGALYVLVGVGSTFTDTFTEVAVAAGANDACDCGSAALDAKLTPSSRETSRRAAVLPAKNSEAERPASALGAGGKMSDWKESAWEQRRVSTSLDSIGRVEDGEDDEGFDY
jgi:hypothetical protein